MMQHVSLSEAARQLGVDYHILRYHHAKGRIRSERVGSMVLVKIGDVKKFTAKLNEWKKPN